LAVSARPREKNLIGRPAILDIPVAQGTEFVFNFNPTHRDRNRGDHRTPWKCHPELAGHQPIVANQLKAAESPARRLSLTNKLDHSASRSVSPSWQRPIEQAESQAYQDV
jgi:hypothetical protein